MKPKRESRTPGHQTPKSSPWIHQRMTRNQRAHNQLKGPSAGSIHRTKNEKEKLLLKMLDASKLVERSSIKKGQTVRSPRRYSPRIKQQDNMEYNEKDISVSLMEHMTPIVVLEKVSGKKQKRLSSSTNSSIISKDVEEELMHIANLSNGDNQELTNDPSHLENWLSQQSMEMEDIKREKPVISSSQDAFDLSSKEEELGEATLDAISDIKEESQKTETSTWSCSIL